MTFGTGRTLSRFRKWFGGIDTPRSLDPLAGSIVVSPDVRASFHDDGIVLLDIRGGTVFRSNRIGAAVWKGFIGRQELRTIAAQIGRDYSIPVEQALEDATGFVAQLESHGLLVRRAGVRA